jgi:hypothetical protein
MKLFNNLILMITALILSISYKGLAQYSADMEVTQKGETKVMKLFVEQPYYRMDISEDGQDMYIIVNNKDNTTLMIMPEQKMYMEMSTAGMQSPQDDIFKQIEKQRSEYETKVVGKEIVNGYECDKYEIRDKGKLISTFWQSPKFEFPIKAITEDGEKTTMELKNIKEGEVDAKLFKVPSGFTKMQMPSLKNY